jgi:hypothetical protein
MLHYITLLLTNALAIVILFGSTRSSRFDGPQRRAFAAEHPHVVTFGKC